MIVASIFTKLCVLVTKTTELGVKASEAKTLIFSMSCLVQLERARLQAWRQCFDIPRGNIVVTVRVILDLFYFGLCLNRDMLL